MVFLFATGVLFALALWTPLPALFGLVVEVVMLSVLFSCLWYYFGDVRIDAEQVEKHIEFYSDDAETDVSMKVVCLCSIGAKKLFLIEELFRIGKAFEGVQKCCTQLLQPFDANFS